MGALEKSENEPKEMPRLLLASCLLASAILTSYALLPTRNYFFDGLKFAQSIEDSRSLGPSLIDPNHLIYRAVGYLAYKACIGAGLRIRALSVLQFLNSILAALTAFFFIRTLRSALGVRRLGIILTLLLAYSATWWKFSTDANCYIPSLLFLVACFYLLLPTRRAHPWLVAATHTMAMLFHQLAFLFFPTALLGLFFQTMGQSRWRRLRTLLAYTFTTALLTLTAYVLGFYLTHAEHDLSSFLRWITTRASNAAFRVDFWGNILLTLRGHVRLCFGGRLAFAFAAAREFTVISTAALLAMSTMLGAIVVRGRAGARDFFVRAGESAKQFSPLARLAIVWIAPYVVFLFFWLPQNAFYRLFYLPAILILLGIVLKPADTAATWEGRLGLPVALAIVALSNLTFLILPYTTLSANPSLRFALEMNRVWQGDTVIYYAIDNPDVWLFRYFNPGARWQLLESYDLETMEKNLEKTYSDGATAWLETSASDALASSHANFQGWLDEHTRAQRNYGLVYPGYRIQFVQILPRLARPAESPDRKPP